MPASPSKAKKRNIAAFNVTNGTVPIVTGKAEASSIPSDASSRNTPIASALSSSASVSSPSAAAVSNTDRSGFV